MRTRFIFSLCTMVLAAALVVGGFSLAWFTDEGKSLSTPTMQTGTVGLQIKVFKPNKLDICWKAWGESRSQVFVWKIHNTGSEPAYVRGQIVEEPSKSEVEWKSSDWLEKREADGTQWFYSPGPIPPNGWAQLTLTGSLPDGRIQYGEYEVYLKAEAIQTANDAIKREWWADYPGGNAND